MLIKGELTGSSYAAVGRQVSTPRYEYSMIIGANTLGSYDMIRRIENQPTGTKAIGILPNFMGSKNKDYSNFR